MNIYQHTYTHTHIYRIFTTDIYIYIFTHKRILSKVHSTFTIMLFKIAKN